MIFTPKLTKRFATAIALSTIMLSCSNDDQSDNDSDTDPDPDPIGCTDPADFSYEEKDGIVTVEFESINELSGWETNDSLQNATGSKYLVWKGSQYLSSPGNGLLTYKIKINNPGTYRFIWRSQIAKGTQGSEHNDSWLRFADADAFYGKKNESIIYPRDTGLTPNPNGASKDGWFKIYLSGAGEWKWQSRTSDNDAHDIYVEFDAAGIYTMEVSARSSHHALDRFTLFNETITNGEGTNDDNEISGTICN